MKKGIIVGIVIVIIAIIIVSIIMISGNKNEEPKQKEQQIQLETASQMQELFNNINTKLTDVLPHLETREIDITDEFSFNSTTGLKSNNNVQAVVASEPFMSSQAYSAVMVKVSKDANIEEMKKEMLDNIDMRKWICVSAQKVWVTNYQDIIFLVMSDEEWGQPVYNEFKQAVGGTVGKELERTEEM